MSKASRRGRNRQRRIEARAAVITSPEQRAHGDLLMGLALRRAPQWEIDAALKKGLN